VLINSANLLTRKWYHWRDSGIVWKTVDLDRIKE